MALHGYAVSLTLGYDVKHLRRNRPRHIGKTYISCRFVFFVALNTGVELFRRITKHEDDDNHEFEVSDG